MEFVVPILRLGSTLIVTVQVELDDKAVHQFQHQILNTIEKSRTTGLIIDISAMDTVDSYVASSLANTGKMARLMGVETVVVGMRPEVAATLVRMGYMIEGIHSALNVEEGLRLLNSLLGAR